MYDELTMQFKVGITAGAFDLTHAGHYLMFKECREQCDWLVVALQSDPSISKQPDGRHKNKPIQTVEERRIQLEACKYINEIIEYNTEQDLCDLLKKLYTLDKIHVRFVGADHEGKPFTGDNLPIKVIFNSRNHNYSSSSLRERIKNNG